MAISHKATQRRSTKASRKKITLDNYLHMSKPKDYTLTISERLAAAKLFNEFKGSITQLAQINDDIKLIAMTKEEWDAVKVTKTPGKDKEGNPLETWNWDDEGTEKAISLGQESVEYLRAKIKAKSDSGELTLEDKGLVSLSEKIA